MKPSGAEIFKNFFRSEKSGGFILVFCAIISLLLSNGATGDRFIGFWHQELDLSFFGLGLNYTIEHWINEGLMTIFFLLVGLEIERELYIGELSSFRNALLPLLAAIGGMLFPSAIHFALNAGTDTSAGFGIPMATDIAFALAVLSLAGKAVPVSLKIFLTALAIIDDLGAITVIAIFYSKSIELLYLSLSLVIFGILFIAGKKKVYTLGIYIAGGVIMWYCMLKSGIHPSISGVLLAFAIPFNKVSGNSLSHKLQNSLHYPVAFLILPLFALANMSLEFPASTIQYLGTRNSIGIIAGLFVGKFAGILIATYAAVKFKIADLPQFIQWRHIAGVAFLGGIGFTMSIFISNLAFADPQTLLGCKISVLAGSLLSAFFGIVVLKGVRQVKVQVVP